MQKALPHRHSGLVLSLIGVSALGFNTYIHIFCKCWNKCQSRGKTSSPFLFSPPSEAQPEVAAALCPFLATAFTQMKFKLSSAFRWYQGSGGTSPSLHSSKGQLWR